LNSSVQDGCGVRLLDNASTFTQSGRGGLPIDPAGFLPAFKIVTTKTPAAPPTTAPSEK
jgi:hypothetical protein